MSKFSVIPKNGGNPKYSGTPTFTGTYMKPGMLEFREAASPSPIEWEPGDKVVYSRTGGLTYRLYSVPQLKKQARSDTYGGAFVYQGVQFFDDSKQLEFCPFRDLVKGDNRVHFSTQPSITTFEAVDGIARRLEACLVDMYGVGSWVVRVATVEDDLISQDLADLMAEAREFTVSGVNLLEALDKVYEVWPEVGWVYAVEDGVNTIVIGGGGVLSTSSFLYGKGNGLTSITRTVANADELANRIFPYGANRNMLPGWYNSQDIKDAASVDIQNLMLPVGPIQSMSWPGWGKTDVSGTMKPDPAKAYVQDDASVLRLGLRPKTVYFDGSGEYPAIYPSLRETTIGMVRAAIGDSTAQYYPSTAKYADASARVDTLMSVQAVTDNGLAGTDAGKANVEMGDVPFSSSGTFTMNAGWTSYPFYHYQGTWTPDSSGSFTLSSVLDLSGQVQLDGIEKCIVSVKVKDPSYQGPVVFASEYELLPDSSGVVTLSGKDLFAQRVLVSSIAYNVFVDVSVYMAAQSTSKTATYSISGNVGFEVQNYRTKTFKVTLRQIGFDIEAQSALGDGKTIAMRSGQCQGRSFAIKSVQYDSANDAWVLECWRSEDESLSQWFPNTTYPVAAGDEFVLLDIAMPDIYVQMAEQKLLTAARELLSDTATERWQYVPEIDAKFMVENNRVITAGQNMTIEDEDVIGDDPVSVLVDTLTINEGEAAIPTYKVTLRDRKRKTWTDSESAEGPSSKPVSTATDTSQSSQSSVADSYFEVVVVDGAATVKLKSQYTGLWAEGFVASGGVGSGGGGGGGATYLDDLQDVNVPSPSAGDLLSYVGGEWVGVSRSEVGTPVTLVNGASYSTLTVNGTSAEFYTKEQIDAIVGAVYRPAGNAATVSELGTLTATNIGKVYNMTAAFTTTADFLEGAGKSFPAGTNVVIVDAGSGTYKYDVLSGFVDLSGLPTLSGNNVFTGTNIFSGEIYNSASNPYWGIESDGSAFFDSLVVGGVSVSPNNYVTALGTSGNYLTWTKGGVTNNITVPFATNATTATKVGSSNVGHSHRPIYLSSGTPTQVTDVASDFIGWPYANHGTMSSLEYLTYMVGPNVFAYPKTNYIDVEYTRDGGTTWVDYGCTDAEKTKLFTTSFGVNVGKKGTTGVAIGDAVRITVHVGVGAYGKCEYIALRHYCPNTCDIKVEYTTYAAQTTWVEHTTLSKISGNPGYRIIPLSKYIFGNNGVHDLRITLTYNSTSSSYVNLVHNIAEIRAYCSNVYQYPSTYAYYGRLYAIDAEQGATFPAAIYANVNGSDLGSSSKRWKLYATTGDFNGSSSATDTTNGINLSYSNATAHIGFSTLLGLYSPGDIVLRPNGASASGAGNGSLVISTNGIVANEKITAEGIVSSDAITLSGSTNTERRIYFGDTSHYLELINIAASGETANWVFHFSHGMYSDGFVASGGVGSQGGGSIGELDDLADVTLTNETNGDLLVYNGTKWVNTPQSSIVPSVSVSFDDLTSHPTTLAGYGITDANISNGVITLGSNSITPLTSHQSLANYVTLDGTQSITGAKTFVNGLSASGHIVPTNASSIGTTSARWAGLYATTADITSVFLRNSSTGDRSGLIHAMDGYLLLRAGSNIDATPAAYTEILLHPTYGLIPSTGNPTLGYSTARWSKVWATDADFSGSVTVGGSPVITSVSLASGTNNGTLKLTVNGTATDNIAVTGLGSLAFKSSLLATDIPDLPASKITSGTFDVARIPDLSDTYVTKATQQSVSGAKTFTGGITMSSHITMGATNHIDIGAARIEYDPDTNAIHITKASGNADIGLYADGFIATGGAGSGSGSGFGVESITSNQDGTVDFHFTGGDVTTVDLNHEHPQYSSKMAESSQPSGGFLPDVVYELGTLTGSVTFALASTVSGQVNHYFWTFTAGSTAPTVTWPSGISWADGTGPTITASKKYQISILDGIAAYMEG